MKPKKASPSPAARRAAPSEQSRAAAKTIRNTKADLLDTITSQRKTIIYQTETMARISDALDLKLERLKLIVLLRRQLEKRLRQAIGDVYAFYEGPRPSGYLTGEISRREQIWGLML